MHPPLSEDSGTVADKMNKREQKKATTKRMTKLLTAMGAVDGPPAHILVGV